VARSFLHFDSAHFRFERKLSFNSKRNKGITEFQQLRKDKKSPGVVPDEHYPGLKAEIGKY